MLTKFIKLFIILSSLIAVPSFSYAAILSDMGWYEIPDTKLRPLDPGMGSAVNPNYPDKTTWYGTAGRFEGIFDAWNSGAYDTKRDKLYIWGGGHGDYFGNEIYALDLNNLSISRLTDPVLPIATSCVKGLVYMPNVDRTGPKTGGQRGKCADAKRRERPVDGRGQGMGRGIGKGRRNQGQGIRKGRFSQRGKNA